MDMKHDLTTSGTSQRDSYYPRRILSFGNYQTQRENMFVNYVQERNSVRVRSQTNEMENA